jgi:lipopolysaccharide assembly outer membrane protein LptD (OstA)
MYNEKGRFLSFRISQPYDFNLDEDNLLPLAINLNARQPQGPFSISHASSYDHYDRQATNMTTRVNMHLKRLSMYAGQQYDRAGEIDVYTTGGTYKASDKLELFTNLSYDELDEGDLEEARAGFDYKSQCWGLRVTYTKRPDDYSFYVRATLLGIGG